MLAQDKNQGFVQKKKIRIKVKRTANIIDILINFNTYMTAESHVKKSKNKIGDSLGCK